MDERFAVFFPRRGRLETPPSCILPVLGATTSERRFAVIWVNNAGIDVGLMILLSGRYFGGDFANLCCTVGVEPCQMDGNPGTYDPRGRAYRPLSQFRAVLLRPSTAKISVDADRFLSLGLSISQRRFLVERERFGLRFKFRIYRVAPLVSRYL